MGAVGARSVSKNIPCPRTGGTSCIPGTVDGMLIEPAAALVPEVVMGRGNWLTLSIHERKRIVL